MCISDRHHPIDACSDLNLCSGHGVCALGQCECVQGYAGADCSQQVSCGDMKHASLFWSAA